MNEKEISEIRRRYRPDKSNITHIRGCCVNEKQEVVSEFNQSLALMSEAESEKMLSTLRRTLSGTLDRNLLDIPFTTSQVMEGEEHKLLMTIRSSAMKDEEAVHKLFEQIIRSLSIEGSYLILLSYDTYDVPYRSQDGEKQEDASTEVYSYLLCSICPVKMTKPALSYDLHQNAFHSSKVDWMVSPPELGFLFPAFDDRSANIYNALYYTRNIEENHSEFVDTIFGCEVPLPAAVQKEMFQSILADTLAEDCSYEVVQAVHEQLCEMIDEHKEKKEADPLVISKGTVKQVLESCGVSESHVSAFEEKYDTEFGAETDLSPKNIIDAKQFEVKTPDVVIKVNPDRSGLIQTRMIEGKKYILIRADDSVEVNGVAIHLS